MKKILALVLCLGLLVSGIVPMAAEPDEGNLSVQTGAGETGKSPQTSGEKGEAPDWGADAFERLYSARVVDMGLNYEDIANLEMTRGRFASYLTLCIQKAASAEKLAAVQPVAMDYFADGGMTKTLSYAAAYGVLEGRTAGGARYGDLYNALTREQAAKMVCSAIDFFTGLGYTIAPTGTAVTYTDVSSISAWAAPFTGRIAAYQIMVGDQNGRFDPQGTLTGASTVVMLDRTFTTMGDATMASTGGQRLQSKLDWAPAAKLGEGTNEISNPWKGYRPGYYTVDNGDGTLTGVVVPPPVRKYTPTYVEIPPTEFFVERYDAAGAVVKRWTLPVELPVFGGFFAGKDCYYMAFGQDDVEETGREAYRIVQYDKDWNRLGAASVTSSAAFTSEPYCATVSRMDESADGSTLVLYTARQRYKNSAGERHQSNIAIKINTENMTVRSVSEQFPKIHVSHSFGQFVRFDGNTLVYADHGDAYPRSFILQTESGGAVSKATLMLVSGAIGDNVTNAIGSGLEVSGGSYLFLGCSIDQSKGTEPWNVFLATVKKGSTSVDFKWLTQSTTSINAARLVKVDDNTFVAMWAQSDGVHYQQLDGTGTAVGAQQVLEGAPMPPTQPVVQGRSIRWIQTVTAQVGQPFSFSVTLPD